MTLVIEDGTIVTGANSYVTASEYQSWADARFGGARPTAPADLVEAAKLILRAMDYFEGRSFKGALVNNTQPLQWPRSSVVIDGYYVDTSVIPKEVKNSIYELAYAEELGNGELNTVGRAVKKSKVEGIEVEYQDSAISTVINLATSKSMAKLVLSSTGVYRA